MYDSWFSCTLVCHLLRVPMVMGLVCSVFCVFINGFAFTRTILSGSFFLYAFINPSPQFNQLIVDVNNNFFYLSWADK